MDILKVVEWIYILSGIAAAIYVFGDIRSRNRVRGRSQERTRGRNRMQEKVRQQAQVAHILWTGFALICPVFCLIIYLLLRDEGSGQVAQVTQVTQVTQTAQATQVAQATQAARMDQAGRTKETESGMSRYIRKCPSCGYLLDEEWRFCPMCRAEILVDLPKEGAGSAEGKETEMIKENMESRENKGFSENKGSGENKWSLRLTLIVVVAAPVIMCLIMAGQMLPRTTQPAGLVQSGRVDVMSAEQNMGSADLKEWIEECSQATDDESAYMMVQSAADEDESRYVWDYLVLYVKGPVEMEQKEGIDYGIGKRTFKLEAARQDGDGQETGTETAGYLVMGRFKHMGDIENRVTIDGKQVDIQMIEPEFDLIQILREEWGE